MYCTPNNLRSFRFVSFSLVVLRCCALCMRDGSFLASSFCYSMLNISLKVNEETFILEMHVRANLVDTTWVLFEC